MLDLAMLKKAPFDLNDGQLAWVKNTLESMTEVSSSVQSAETQSLKKYRNS